MSRVELPTTPLGKWPKEEMNRLNWLLRLEVELEWSYKGNLWRQLEAREKYNGAPFSLNLLLRLKP